MIKKNSLVFSVLGALTLLTLLSFASALTISGSTTPLPQTNGSFTLTTASSAGAGTLSYVVKSSEGTVYTGFTFNQSTFTGNETLTVLYTIPAGFDFEFGEDYTITVTAIETVIPANNATTALTFAQTPFYNGENQGDLSISDININDNDFGDDEDYWYPLDNVEITLNVANDGDWKIKNIEVQVCLWDENKEKCIMDEDDMDLSNDKFDLKSGKDQDVTINFQVDPDKLTAGNRDYTLYIRAIGEIDDGDSTYDGDTTGDSDSQTIEIVTDDSFVILDNLQIVGTLSCGESVQISGEIWNIGDDDERDVYFKVYNTALGISQKIEVGDIDSLESKDISFTLVIPEDAEEGNYDLGFLVYDDSDDLFENSNDDQSKFALPISIASGSCSTTPSVSVFANLESSAVAGKELSIRATITNTASVKKTFVVELGNYANWASLISVDKTSVTLESESSADVLIKLRVNEMASGDNTFNIVMKEGNKVLTQPVSVSIEKQGLNITGLFSKLQGNAYLWGIGALNVLLVLIIIIVAIKVVRKK